MKLNLSSLFLTVTSLVSVLLTQAAGWEEQELVEEEYFSDRSLAALNNGSVTALILLVKFSDHADREVPPRTFFDERCNGVDGNLDWTIKEYFLDQSYGAYDVTCDVIDWATTDNTEAYYSGGNGGEGLTSDQAAGFFIPVLNQMDNAGFDFTKYDLDQNGLMDALVVIHSGFSSVEGSTTDSGSEDCGNTRQYRIRSQGTASSQAWISANGLSGVSNFAIVSAYTRLCVYNDSGIGVWTHEWIHTLNPIDTYDTSSGNIGGLGSYDIMAMPGGYLGNNSRPGSMSPFTKGMAGWIKYKDITQDGTYTIKPSNTDNMFYRIQGKLPDGEYFVIENRQPIRFDEELYGGEGGLLIYYNDDKIEGFGTRGYPGQSGWPGNGNHYKSALLQADGKYDLEQGVNTGDAGDLWKPGMTLGPGTGTYPNTDSYTNGPTGITITDITSLGSGLMSFRVQGVAPASPTVPTPAPVSPPTAPTSAPVSQPTTTDAAAPVSPPTAPTPAPVNPPTSPTPAPGSPQTTPTSSPGSPPTAPTSSPVSPPTAPTSSPVSPPTAPTSSPVSPPTTTTTDAAAPVSLPTTDATAPNSTSDAPVSSPTKNSTTDATSPVSSPTKNSTTDATSPVSSLTNNSTTDATSPVSSLTNNSTTTTTNASVPSPTAATPTASPSKQPIPSAIKPTFAPTRSPISPTSPTNPAPTSVNDTGAGPQLPGMNSVQGNSTSLSNETNSTPGGKNNAETGGSSSSACMALQPGDISLWVLDSVAPDAVAFFPVVTLSEAVGKLFLTDNAWNGTGLQDTEGTYEYTIPDRGIEAGQTFGLLVGTSTDWKLVDNSTFALTPAGDNIFLYCLDDKGAPHFIFGFSYFGDWKDNTGATYGVGESGLPEQLAGAGSVAVQGNSNWRYTGPTGTTADEMKVAFTNASNWDGSDLRFDVKQQHTTSAVKSTAVMTMSLFLSLVVVFVVSI